jgi:hypothetical protein
MSKYLLILIAVFPLSGFAELNLLEGGAEGPSHIDPIENTALIHYTQTVPGAMKVTYTYPKDAAGRPINNFYVIERKNAAGVVETVQEISTDVKCEDVLKDPLVVTCKGYSALEIRLREPEGTAGAPQTNSMTIRLDDKALQDQIKAASPENQFVIIRDAKTPLGIVASMQNKSFCSLDRKRVDFDGPWNDAKYPSQIYTSDQEPGFFIGDHTYYFYDEKQSSWCYHFLPDLSTTAPVCSKDFNNRSFRIDFAFKGTTDTINRGVVKLSVDKDGNPTAYVAAGAAAPTTGDAQVDNRTGLTMDTTKPFMKIQFPKSDKGVRSTTFQAWDKSGGTAGRTLTVSPTYAFGDSFKAGAICDAGACLNPVDQITAAADASTSKLCKKNDSPMDLNNTVKDQNNLCYSCDGVTPGACSATKSLITKANYNDTVNLLNSCKSAATPSGPIVPQGETPTAQ